MHILLVDSIQVQLVIGPACLFYLGLGILVACTHPACKLVLRAWVVARFPKHWFIAILLHNPGVINLQLSNSVAIDDQLFNWFRVLDRYLQFTSGRWLYFAKFQGLSRVAQNATFGWLIRHQLFGLGIETHHLVLSKHLTCSRVDHIKTLHLVNILQLVRLNLLIYK